MKNVFDYRMFVLHEEDCRFQNVKKEVLESKHFKNKKLHYYSHVMENFSYEFLLVHEAKMQYEVLPNNISKRTLFALKKHIESLGYTEYKKGETK